MTISKPIATLVAALALATIVGCTATENGATSDGADEISQGLGSQDASKDVKVVSFKGPDAVGMYTATVEVTNHSSGTSDYYIEANVLDASGTVTDYTNGLVNNLQPDARATVELIPVTAADGYKIQITEVQRTAS